MLRQWRGRVVPTGIAALRRALLPGKCCTWWRRGSSRAGRGRRGPAAWGCGPGTRRASRGRPAACGDRAPVRPPPRLTAPHFGTPAPASPLLTSARRPPLRLSSARRPPPRFASPQHTAPPPPPPLHSPRPSHLTGRAGKHGPSPQSTPWRKQVQDCWPEGGKNKNVRPEKGPRRFPSAAAASSPRSGVRGACGCLPGWRQRLLRVRYRWAASSA